MDDIKEIGYETFEQLVVFQLANEYYGVDIGAVSTIIRMQELTAVPQTPTHVMGVINLRGSIIPVIDLRKRFHLKQEAITKSSRIVVVESNGAMVGMIVDAVAETMRISSSMIESPSVMIASVESEYLRGIAKQDDRLVILLNINIILGKTDLDTLTVTQEKVSDTGAVAA